MSERPQALDEHVENLVHQLVVALVNLDMYAPSSSQVEVNMAQLLEALRHVAAAIAAEPVVLEMDGERLRFAGEPLLGASLQAGRLLRLCADRSIRALQLHRGCSAAEMLRFLQLLRDPLEASAFEPSARRAAFASLGIRHVDVQLLGEPPSQRLEPPSGALAAATTPAATGTGDGEGELPRTPAPAIRQYQAMADFLHSNHVHAYRGDELQMDAAAGVVERAMSHMDAEPSALLALAMYDDIDSFTVGHSVRVTLLALQVARAAGASRQQLLQVGTAALLHDIGKSRIPQHILFKAGSLDPEERATMAEHARIGGEILLEQRGVDPTAIGAAFCHHMGPNGTGYPTPALPFDPSGVSKLVRVCDVFEALTSARPYKAAMPPLHAYAIMQRMQHGFDPRWLRFFTRSIGLYPVGTRVVLDEGEEALVVAGGPSLHQPVVQVLQGPGGCAASPEAPLTTIGRMQEGRVRVITAVLGAGHRYDLPTPLYTSAAEPDAAAPGAGSTVDVCAATACAEHAPGRQPA